eukprot:943142-Pyramimonas_sp.AAC.1
MDFLVADAASSVAMIRRGAHRARTPGQPHAGPSVLPLKNTTMSTFFSPTCTFSSPAPRIARREGDAAHIARDACSSTWTFLSSTLRPV